MYVGTKYDLPRPPFGDTELEVFDNYVPSRPVLVGVCHCGSKGLINCMGRKTSVLYRLYHEVGPFLTLISEWKHNRQRLWTSPYSGPTHSPKTNKANYPACSSVGGRQMAIHLIGTVFYDGLVG
jgi:hypothetical protein